MSWILLILAGVFEVAFAACLGKARVATGSQQYLWYAMFLVTMSLSMGLLLKASQQIPIGTAYTVWTGIGAAGTVIIGILFFKDPVNFWRIFFITTLVVSIVGLKISS